MPNSAQERKTEISSLAWQLPTRGTANWLLPATPVFLERPASFEICKPDRSNVSEKLQSLLFPIFLGRKLQV